MLCVEVKYCEKETKTWSVTGFLFQLENKIAKMKMTVTVLEKTSAIE